MFKEARRKTNDSPKFVKIERKNVGYAADRNTRVRIERLVWNDCENFMSKRNVSPYPILLSAFEVKCDGSSR